MGPMAFVSDFLLKTDVVIILDCCCYSGSAIRGSRNCDRIVEVISAVGPSTTQDALGNLRSGDQRVASAITFTARVATEISLQHKEGANTTCFAEIIQRLIERSSKKGGPQYMLMDRTQTIRVPSQGCSPSSYGP